MTQTEFHALRMRYRMAFEACKGLVEKPDDQLTASDRKLLEALEAAASALRAALGASAPDVP